MRALAYDVPLCDVTSSHCYGDVIVSYTRVTMPLAHEPTLSQWNDKMGHTVNVSLLPIVTCPSGCGCAKECYAMKACRKYPSVRQCWTDNTTAAKSPAKFMRGIVRQLKLLESRGKLPRFFRWHVAGDCPSLPYMRRAIKLATMFPSVHFLMFTKRYEWASKCSASLPDNFAMVLSAWPTMPMVNPHSLPVAYMQDGTETRVPDNAITCPGSCDGCGMCWNLPKLGRCVVFEKH